MDIIKGESITVVTTVYKVWTGQVSTSQLADLTGAVAKLYVKKRDGDSDANALFTKSPGNLVDPLNGVVEHDIDAGDTNNLSYQKLVYEVVTKLANGKYIRNGVQPLNLKTNVGKTLF